MLDLRFVQDNLDQVRAGLSRRSTSAVEALSGIEELLARRKTCINETEVKQGERNRASEEMAVLAKSGDKAGMNERREALKVLSQLVKDLEAEKAKVEGELEELLLNCPNLPIDSVPSGHSEADNVELRVVGEAPQFDFTPINHWEIGEKLEILDFERAAKLSGARFSVLRGDGARLERALIQYMLNLHTGEAGYTEVSTPYLVRASALRGTGNLPKFEKDLFKTQKETEEGVDTEPLYLIPTAEVPVTNLHAEEILEGAELPIAYCAYTPCFRSEAGSYGKDVRGLIRQHQFQKIELVRFCRPEDGEAQLDLLTSHAEAVLKGLGLHYRVVQLCAGDMGFSSQKTYDIEVWLPGQQAFREISSCSWFGDFQSRRAKIRYRAEPKSKPALVHTINGSALAVGRTLVAVLEQYQQADGSVRVPEVLRPYVGKDVISL